MAGESEGFLDIGSSGGMMAMKSASPYDRFDDASYDMMAYKSSYDAPAMMSDYEGAPKMMGASAMMAGSAMSSMKAPDFYHREAVRCTVN